MTGHGVHAPEHIVILGPSKTGTTGLYAAVKNGLADAGIPARTIFEPPTVNLIDSMFRHAPCTTLMTKVTMDKLDAVIPDIRVFDHRIMTVRDPRDILVSSLLFRPLTLRNIARADASAVERFIAALEEKEADPSSHSVRGLFALAYELGIGRRPFQDLARVLDRQRELLLAGLVHVVRYERFVQGDLEDLSESLGFAVANAAARDGSWIGHITRSKSSGEFTRWFREDDLRYFNGMYGEHLRLFGYDVDVSGDSGSRIEPATSSQYVRRRYAERRAKMSENQEVLWTPRDVSSHESLSVLTERAQDGDPRACVRVAKVLLSGHLGTPDPAGALDWARFAAQLGSVEGRGLAIDVLRRSDPADPALRRELRVWQTEGTRADGAARSWRAPQQTRPRRSTGQRLRSGLSYAARNPRKSVRKGLRLVGSRASSLRR